MRKKGFTLQELLITMAIVGIVAALALPALVQMQPDKSKTMYIKAYNALTSLTVEILEDPSLYYTTYNANGIANCTGMRCTSRPVDEKISNAFSIEEWNEGDKKFGVCLASKLNIRETFGPDIIFGTLGNDGTRFTTTDGIQWTYEPNNLNDAELTINLNPSDDRHDCLYSAECTSPNQFKFLIDDDGGIVPADALGMAYLQDPTNMHSKGGDGELAAQIVSQAGSSSDVNKMSAALNKIKNKNTSKDDKLSDN